MTGIRRFEEIQSWQVARELTKQIYQLTRKAPFSQDYGLKDQIQRASVSIMANIAEGFDCNSRIEFSRFLGFARRSAVEVQSLLYAALDAAYLEQNQFDHLYNQAEKIKALISGLRNTLKINETKRT